VSIDPSNDLHSRNVCTSLSYIMVTAVLDEVILPVSLLAISIRDRICVNTVKPVSQPVRTHLETTMNAEKESWTHPCSAR